jgi:hypothetical protein
MNTAKWSRKFIKAALLLNLITIADAMEDQLRAYIYFL